VNAPLPKKNYDPAILIGGELAGLWTARILGRRSVDVYLITDNPKDIALSSKYCKKKNIVKSPWTRQVLKKTLTEASHSTTKRLVVYPSTDELALNLSILKDELPDDYEFVVGKKNAVETIVNKKKFYQELKKTKIPFPTTYFPNDLDEAKHLATQIPYPILVKPAMTHVFNKAFGPEIKCFEAKSSDELLKYYHLTQKANVEVVFQQNIAGKPNTFYQLEGYYDRKNNPTALFARQAMRIWPLDFGTTTLCQSIELSNLSKESQEISNLLIQLGYNGLMSADFKRDPEDGKLKLLEINSRIWLHFWLPTACGVDILFASYLDAIGEKMDMSHYYVVGMKSLHFAMDFKSSFKMIRQRELSVTNYFSSLMGKKVYAFFSREDVLPFLYYYVSLARQTLRI
jgi:D-aspartate ligase